MEIYLLFFASKLRASAKTGIPNVFISYSRKDSPFAETLATWLKRRDMKVLIDRNDIAAGEEWKRRLSDLIESADAVVFVVSFASVTSETCKWEIARAEELRKRIIPILRDAVPDRELPAGLAKINYIPFLDAQTVETSFDNLVAAINVDIAWVREHTRLGQIAGRWDGRDRTSALLLRGHELADAERWMEQRPVAAPVPTDRLLAFLQASRRGSTRRQRLAVATALSVAAVTAALAVAAYVQRGEAIVQKDAAVQARELAELNAREAAQQRASAQRSQSRYLADLSAQHARRGEHETAALLALEAMPDPDDANPRPVVPEARQALYEAIWGQRVVGEWRGTPMSELLAPVHDMIKEYVAHQAKLENDKLAGTPTTADAKLGDNGEQDMDSSRPSWLPSMFKNLKPESLKTVRDLREIVGEYLDKVLGSFVRGAALSPDGEQVAIDLANGSVLVMDALSRKVLHTHACDPVTDDRELKALAQSGGIESQVEWSADGTITVRRKPLPGVGSGAAAPVCMFTPDGKGRMVVERPDRFLVIDTATGKELLSKMLKPERKLAVRGGRGWTHLILEVAGEKGVLVWDVLAGKQTAHIEPQVPSLLPALDHSWDIDGRWLCARGALIDAATGKRIAALNLPGYRVHRCTVHAPTERVVTLSLSTDSERGVVALWNATTGAMLVRHDLQIQATLPPPPANASAKRPRGADLGSDIEELKEVLETTRGEFDATGRFVWFTTPQGQWRFLDVKTGATAFEINGRDAGGHGILSQLARRVPRWQGGLKPNVDAARSILERIKHSGEQIRNYAFHPIRPLMAVARSEAGQKGTVQIWDLERRAIVQTLSGMEAEKLSVAFSSDGHRLMVYDSDMFGAARSWGFALHRLWVWGEIPVAKETLLGTSLPFGSERRWELRLDLSKLFDFQSAINMPTASERIVAVRDFGFGVGVMSTAAVGRNVAMIDTGGQPLGATTISELAFAKDGKSIAAVVGNSPTAWDISLPTPTRLASGLTSGAPAPGATALTGAVLTLGQKRPTTNHELWDVEGKRAVELPDTRSVAVIDVGGGRAVMAADGGDYFVAALDLPQKRVKLQVPDVMAMPGRAQVAEQGIPGFAPVVRMSPTGKRAVVSDASGGAGIYDTTTGVRIATLEVVNDELKLKIDETMKLVPTGGKKLGRYLSTASFSPDGRLLAGGWLADVQATVWEVETGRVLARQKESSGRVAMVAFSPDGKVVATATDAPVVRLWKADTGDHLL